MDYSIRTLTEVQSNLHMINTVFDLGHMRLPNGDFVCATDNDTQWDPYNNLAHAETMAHSADAVIRLRKTTGAYAVVALGHPDAVVNAWAHHAPVVSLHITIPDGRGFSEPLMVRAPGSRCPEKVMAIMITCAFEQFAKELCAA